MRRALSFCCSSPGGLRPVRSAGAATKAQSRWSRAAPVRRRRHAPRRRPCKRARAGLGDKDRAMAHKHLAFIHCAPAASAVPRRVPQGARRRPATQLDAAEAGHPVWGPIFRSMSGRRAQRRPQAVRGRRLRGIGEEPAGRDRPGPADKERANAHKHLAFIHCSSNRAAPCRDEFRKALAIDPALELAPGGGRAPGLGAGLPLAEGAAASP